ARPSPAPRPASRSQAPAVFSDYRCQRRLVQTEVRHQLASSFTGDPASICFTAPMIFSSLCFAFFIRKTPLSQFGAFQIMSGRDYREQVSTTVGCSNAGA